MPSDPISLQATIIPRCDHTLSRANISPNALKVMYRLSGAGFRACLVGGGVRDLLLDNAPKDFDIATDAHPEDVYRLFRNCRLIGRRFRLAHVHFGPEIIEVATFRGRHDSDDSDHHDDDHASEHGEDGNVSADEASAAGMIVSDNVYGTIEEDAQRRDFTINALYYDIDDFSVLDYAGGMDDLDAGLIRLIGDPELRYREDPVRMLRAVRFAAKLGFRLAPDTEAPLQRLGDCLDDVPSARLFDETLKLFLSGHAIATFELLRLFGLLEPLLPMTDASLDRDLIFRRLLKQVCENTDTRIAEDKPVTPSFLFAALLWAPLRERLTPLLASDMTPREAFDRAADEVIERQLKHTALPRRFSGPMREIWLLQERFSQRSGKRPLRFLSHPRFRAAYDFLLLRAGAGESADDNEDLNELAAWWTDFQHANRDAMADNTRTDEPAGKRKRPRRRRPSRDALPALD